MAAAGCSVLPEPVATLAPAAAVRQPVVAVSDAWVQATSDADEQRSTPAYLILANSGDADVRLTSAGTTADGMVQLHELAMVGGELAMQEVVGGIAVPAGGHVHLMPGGPHLMLLKLTGELAVGDPVGLDLHFSDGSSLGLIAEVRDSAADEGHRHSGDEPAEDAPG